MQDEFVVRLAVQGDPIEGPTPESDVVVPTVWVTSDGRGVELLREFPAREGRYASSESLRFSGPEWDRIVVAAARARDARRTAVERSCATTVEGPVVQG